jgi:DNA replication protein DnaC
MQLYRAPKVLIIDEMGVYSLDQLGASLFFQLVAARYEKGSIILPPTTGVEQSEGTIGYPYPVKSRDSGPER